MRKFTKHINKEVYKQLGDEIKKKAIDQNMSIKDAFNDTFHVLFFTKTGRDLELIQNDVYDVNKMTSVDLGHYLIDTLNLMEMTESPD